MCSAPIKVGAKLTPSRRVTLKVSWLYGKMSDASEISRGGASRKVMCFRGMVFARVLMMVVCMRVVSYVELCRPELVMRALLVRVVMMT